MACSSETTVNGSGGASGGGGSPSGGTGGVVSTGGTAGSIPTGGGTGGGAGSGGTTPTGGTGGGGTGGSDGGPDCDAGPIPCGVQVIAQGVAKPYGLVVHDTGVYFTNFDTSGQVLFCPKSGCTTAPTPLASSQSLPKRMARYGTKLFWTNNGASGSVQSCTIPCPQTSPVATSIAGADHVAVSPTHVFFSDGQNQIRRCEHAGTACTPLVTAEAPIGGLAYSSVTKYLYWSVPSKGYIRSCNATDCAAGQPNFIQGNPNVSAITTNPTGDTVFSSHELNPSPLKKCPATGCSLIPEDLTVNTFLASPVSIAADDVNVFVLESTSRVSRCAAAKCPQPTVLATPSGAPGTVAVDDSYVYWTMTVGSAGYVLRASK